MQEKVGANTAGRQMPHNPEGAAQAGTVESILVTKIANNALTHLHYSAGPQAPERPGGQHAQDEAAGDELRVRHSLGASRRGGLASVGK